jgi:molybdopterin-biosynthesis enzyme MoeA-like protein
MAMLFEGDTDPTPAEGMVTVGRFESPIEAQMAKGMLESAGVECQLVGENVNSLMQAAFRVRLQVREEDEAAARELMRQTSESESGDKEPDENV